MNSNTSTTFTQGDYVCTDGTNAAKVVDNGLVPCPGSQLQVGVVLVTDGSAGTSHTVTLRSGAAFSGSVLSINSGSGGSLSAGTSSSVVVYGFYVPYTISTSAIVYDVSTADTSHPYSIGIYSGTGGSTGNLVVSVGPSSSLMGAGVQTQNWASTGTLTPGKYWLAIATSCPSTCAKLVGNGTTTFQSGGSAGSPAGGGALNATVTLPADSWTLGNIPTFAIH